MRWTSRLAASGLCAILGGCSPYVSSKPPWPAQPDLDQLSIGLGSDEAAIVAAAGQDLGLYVVVQIGPDSEAMSLLLSDAISLAEDSDIQIELRSAKGTRIDTSRATIRAGGFVPLFATVQPAPFPTAEAENGTVLKAVVRRLPKRLEPGAYEVRLLDGGAKASDIDRRWFRFDAPGHS